MARVDEDDAKGRFGTASVAGKAYHRAGRQVSVGASFCIDGYAGHVAS
jgi:hypothetical protein